MRQLGGLAILWVSAAALACGAPPAGVPAARAPAAASPSAKPAAPPDPPPGAAPMRGPFASVDDLCEQLERDHAEDREVNGTCRMDGGDWDVPANGELVLARPPAPFAEARLVATEALDISCHLLARLQAGWFLGPPLPCGSARSRSDQKITGDIGRVFVPRGRAAPIQVRVHIRAEHDGVVRDTLQQILCGVDAGGRPWCARD